VLLLVVLAAAGCSQTVGQVRAGMPPRPDRARVLVVPPDVELHELTAGGLMAPRAEWTAAARTHVAAAVAAEVRGRGAAVVDYVAPVEPARGRRHAQVLALHDVVVGAVLTYQYDRAFRLPSKQGRFDWSIGPAARALGEDAGDPHYALFVVFRDSHASPGRQAAMVGLALLGVGVSGGRQAGVASLVDLATGDLLWCNRLVDPVGDLRTGAPARKAVASLLSGMPL
jgi:hypothetical protein